MLPYAFTIFLSAMLLFQVQMVLGKYLLPWYGGVPSVWTSCMLFFQCVLLGGYAYAHWLTRRSAAVQRRVHLGLLGASLAALGATALLWSSPLLPAPQWRPLGDEDPAWHILRLLALGAGLPFFALSATAPLLQRWFSLAHDRSPYPLYALSNLGSLLGLLGYPLLVEVLWPLRTQALGWAAGYALFALSAALVVLAPRRTAVAAPAAAAAPPPGAGRRLLWFALAACASVLLLAVTNQLCQELAVVPLLWVLPLSLYLLSFVLCFESERGYRRGLYLALLVPALALVTLTLQFGVSGDPFSQVVIYGAALFVACMVCHGELARLKPAPGGLTSFYLTLTAGGAAGGVFVGLLAPRLFAGNWEISVGLFGCAALAVVVLARERSPLLFGARSTPAWLTLFAAVLLAALAFSEPLATAATSLAAPPPAWTYAVAVAAASLLWLRARRRAAHPQHAAGAAALRRRTLQAVAYGPRLAMASALLIFAGVHLAFVHDTLARPLQITRNFFGVLQVIAERADGGEPVLRLLHGRTFHGMQYLSPEHRYEPNTYYRYESGAGVALLGHRRRARDEGLRVGVVGLGTGTLAAYARPHDYFRFYEINPAVVELSDSAAPLFTYLRDSAAPWEVVLGDARVALEREHRAGAAQRFDVLLLDAFNSGSIPAHLLTREAFDVYLAHLEAQDGLLAVHISNRYLDLRPLLRALAARAGLALAFVEYEDSGPWSSQWALLARRADALPLPVAAPDSTLRVAAWSDDYSNVLPMIRLRPSRERAPDTPAALEGEATWLDPAR